jgi:hypothetical protein
LFVRQFQLDTADKRFVDPVVDDYLARAGVYLPDVLADFGFMPGSNGRGANGRNFYDVLALGPSQRNIAQYGLQLFGPSVFEQIFRDNPGHSLRAVLAEQSQDVVG